MMIPLFVLVSKLYRQMYANTGIATDSATVSITVTAVNDNLPVITSNAGAANAASIEMGAGFSSSMTSPLR